MHFSHCCRHLIQNVNDRLIFAVGRNVDADSLLERLHWLPVEKRVIYKILLYVYKALNCLAPAYISQCIQLYQPSLRLRSANDQTQLYIPREFTSIGRNKFTIAAAYQWNKLPKNIRIAPSVNAFKKLLKTHLF